MSYRVFFFSFPWSRYSMSLILGIKYMFLCSNDNLLFEILYRYDRAHWVWRDENWEVRTSYPTLCRLDCWYYNCRKWLVIVPVIDVVHSASIYQKQVSKGLKKTFTCERCSLSIINLYILWRLSWAGIWHYQNCQFSRDLIWWYLFMGKEK